MWVPPRVRDFPRYGKYTYASGSTYEGQWDDEVQCGVGTERWGDGSVFEGHFLNGEKHGPGKFVWSTGCVYEGEFNGNDMHVHVKTFSRIDFEVVKLLTNRKGA